MTYPPDINVWLVLQYLYPWVGSLTALIDVDYSYPWTHLCTGPTLERPLICDY